GEELDGGAVPSKGHPLERSGGRFRPLEPARDGGPEIAAAEVFRAVQIEGFFIGMRRKLGCGGGGCRQRLLFLGDFPLQAFMFDTGGGAIEAEAAKDPIGGVPTEEGGTGESHGGA